MPFLPGMFLEDEMGRLGKLKTRQSIITVPIRNGFKIVDRNMTPNALSLKMFRITQPGHKKYFSWVIRHTVFLSYMVFSLAKHFFCLQATSMASKWLFGTHLSVKKCH